MRKWFVIAIVSLLVAGAVTSVQAIGCDPHQGTPIEGGCLYTITGGDTPDPSDGFPIVDVGGIDWYSCVRTLDLQDVGYPIGQQFEFSGFQILPLQKVMLQYRPDYQDRGGCSKFAYLNSMDLLANRFGVNLPGVPAHRVLPEDEGASFSQIIENHLRLLDANPVLKAKFLEKSNWIDLYGLPIAYEEQEINGNPQGAQVLRAQRAVWRIFNVPAPGTRVGVPHLLNVPDQIKKLDGIIIPQDAKRPVSFLLASGHVPEPMALPQGLRGYGMQGEFRRSDDQRLANLITGAGFGWVKQQVPWEEVDVYLPDCRERPPSQWFWDDLDRFVNTMRSSGLNILLSVVKAPACLKAPGSPEGHGPPVDPATFGRFMRELASRYKGRVQAYELWNEANLQREWPSLRPAAPQQHRPPRIPRVGEARLHRRQARRPECPRGPRRDDAGGQHADRYRRPGLPAAPLGGQRRGDRQLLRVPGRASQRRAERAGRHDQQPPRRAAPSATAAGRPTTASSSPATSSSTPT